MKEMNMKQLSRLGSALKQISRLGLVLAATALLMPSAQARHSALSHHARRHHGSAASSRTVKAPADQGVRVWVNTKSGVYHFPGERYYGNTAEGQYMSEDAAKRAGYRATENGQ